MSGQHSRGVSGRPRRRISEYIVGAVCDLIFLVLVNRVPGWNIRFITEAFPEILWAVNTSLAVSLAGNLLLILVHPRFLHHLLNAVFSLFGILALSVTLSVFPFEFAHLVGEWLNILARIILIIGIVGSAIGAVVHLVKAFTSLFRSGD